MKDIKIKINKATRMVELSKSTIGNDGETLQSRFVFEFEDEFVNGQARLEYVINGETKYVFLDREGETYTTLVKSFLTKKGTIDMQLVILEGIEEENIPIFKSNMFYVYCNSSINAEIKEEEVSSDWFEKANTKLNQADNLNITTTQIQNGVQIDTTSKEGVTSSTEVVNGVDGKDGYTPVKGVDYFDGKDGTNGVDGKTPVKGTDYYTEADKQEMVNLVLKEIPPSEGVAELITPITYEELKTLRDNAELVAGMFYRITDYVTTSIQEATQSAGHQFDIIVRALDEKTLDGEAKAIQSENDEYFANSNLTGWQVWYTLDNDTSKYAWADVNGKGVIYRLIDENGNDLPYDFKNIQMLDANNSEDTTYYYTFDSKGVDHSLNGSKCFNNEINKYIDGTQRVNRIIFKCNNAEVSTNFFDFECYNNTMGSCDHMKFGRECYGNVFEGLNHLCTFDTKFRNNFVGSETQSIQVGQGASNNHFSRNIYYSSFGTYFRNNKVAQYTYYSTFGNYVQNFIMGKSADELGQYMRYLTIENGVTYVNLYKTDATTKTYMENIRICSGTNGTSSNRINIEVEELAQKYAIVYGNNSKGELKKYCVADFTDIPTYEDGDEVSY